MNNIIADYRLLLLFLFLNTLEVVATCSFYNQETGDYEHWDCPTNTNCCLYFGEQSCCAAKEPYMNSGYEQDDEGTIADTDGFADFFESNYNTTMAVLSVVISVGIVVLCCLQWRQQRADIEENEESEMARINAMIAQSELLRVPGSRSSTGSPYRSPESFTPQPTSSGPMSMSSELTLITAQQPPSYDSINKDLSPPPPYAP